MFLASQGDHVRRRCTGVHHAGFEPSFALSVCLTDWWVSVDWKAVSVFHFVLPLPCLCQSGGLTIFVCPLVFFPSSCFVFSSPYTCFFRLVQIPIPVRWWKWPFGTSSYLNMFFYLPVPLISLSDCTPYFHISLLSFFVLFPLSAVHIKHWHQIDSHVNKDAVGGQGPLPQALKLLPILFTAPQNTPTPPTNRHTLYPTSGFGRSGSTKT